MLTTMSIFIGGIAPPVGGHGPDLLMPRLPLGAQGLTRPTLLLLLGAHGPARLILRRLPPARGALGLTLARLTVLMLKPRRPVFQAIAPGSVDGARGLTRQVPPVAAQR